MTTQRREVRGRGKGGEMTQTLYAHMNIIKKRKEVIKKYSKGHKRHF
jgi:hypothetical protein